MSAPNPTIPQQVLRRRPGFAAHAACSLAAALLGGAPGIQAQTNAGAGPFTPAQAVALTLAHSPALRAADEEVRAAGWRRRQADAAGAPTLDARASAQHYDGLDNQPIGPGFMIPEIPDRYAASAGVTLPLYTGGRVAGARDASLWSETAARFTRAASRDELALQATSAYWAWARTLQQAAALSASVVRVGALLADVTTLHKAGLATENDLLATQVQFDQAQLRYSDCTRQTEQAAAWLACLTGQPLPADARPVPPADTQPAIPDLAAAQAAARTNRADVAAAQAAVEAARQQVRVAGADSHPQVALAARYEQARPNALDFPPTDEWNGDAFVGATATWSVWDGGLAHARAGEAQARARQAAAQAQQVVERSAWQVANARIALAGAIDRVATARHAESSASRNLKTATDLWKGGLTRHSEVLEAESRLTDSQFQTISALTDVQVSEAQLHYALGTIARP